MSKYTKIPKSARDPRRVLLILAELPESVRLFRLPLYALDQDKIDVLKVAHGRYVNLVGTPRDVEKAILNILHACTKLDSVSRTDPECCAHVSKSWRNVNWAQYEIPGRAPVGSVVAAYHTGMVC